MGDRFTEEQAKKAAQDFSNDVDDNGCWVAECTKCGTMCGCRLVGHPPSADSKKYVACPDCSARGDEIKWRFDHG